jgi:hypothetical protein
MKTIFGNMGRRNGLFGNLFGRRRSAVTPARAGIGLGTLASIAAPFVIRKLMARRAAAQQA